MLLIVGFVEVGWRLPAGAFLLAALAAFIAVNRMTWTAFFAVQPFLSGVGAVLAVYILINANALSH